MRYVLLVCGVLALLLGAGSGRAAEPAKPALDVDLPYQAKRTNPVTYDVDFAAVVTPPYHAKVLKVWLPLPQTDAAQEVTEGDISTFPVKVTPKIGAEARYSNKFAYFEFDHPEGAQIIRHKFKIKVWELHWDIDPQKVTAVKEWPAGFDKFLRGEEQAVVVNDQVRKMAKLFVPESRGAAHDLASIMAGVNGFMKYDHASASLHAGSEHAAKNQRGHCSDYHGLCAAVGRALGYPARVTYGINPFPKNSPSHCKMEAYLPPYGWVSFDVSETQGLIINIQKDATLDAKRKDELIALANRRLIRGYRDNTWFLQTKGTDYDLAPPGSKRVAVVRTIYAEADGVELPDPDPANPQKREFAWMTVHQYKAEPPVRYTFKDWKGLEK